METGPTYLVKDLIGCLVVTTDGVEVGKIWDVMKTKANDVYVVWHNSKETLIPALKDVVLKIDVEKKRIEVKLPEGLL